MTSAVRASVIIAGCALLAWAWAAAGYWLATPWIALSGSLWIFAGGRWAPVGYIALTLAALAAGLGDYLHLSSILLVLAFSFALAAWDLDHVSRRLALAAKQDDITGLERRHVTKLGLVLLAGAALSLTAILSHDLRLTFEITAGLALLAAWGLTYLLVRLRRAA
jgi:hypothetical protein